MQYECKRMIGILPFINYYKHNLVLVLDKASLLVDKGCVCSVHEFHYANGISNIIQKYQFIVRTRYCLYLSGNVYNNVRGSYLHYIDVV